jgi:hypothetical protein
MRFHIDGKQVFVGDRQVRIAFDMDRYDQDEVFGFNPNQMHHYWKRGFRTTFENGIVLSTVWGTGMYCAMRDSRPDDGFTSPDAECAAWYDFNEPWIDIGNGVGEPRGWVPPDNWWDLWATLAEMPSRKVG